LDEIIALNRLIREHCRVKKIRLVDAYYAFNDGNDNLASEFSNGDGGHLNAKGYKKLGEFIVTQLTDLLKPGMKVACLGDSITEGYPGHFVGQEKFRKWDPYPMYLEKKGVKALNFGRSGDTTDGMIARFFRDVKESGAGLCIVLGGVNDLFGMVPAQQVFENLASIYADCQHLSILPVAVTVLPID